MLRTGTATSSISKIFLIEARAQQRFQTEQAEYEARITARDAKTQAVIETGGKKQGGKPPSPPTAGPPPPTRST
jgi:hypothetical protein